MVKPTPRRGGISAFGRDAVRFVPNNRGSYPPPPSGVFECRWPGCMHPQWSDVPLCYAHVLEVNRRLGEALAERDALPEDPKPDPIR